MQESTSPKTVLLVDDNPGDVFLLRRALARCGIADRIQVARDGEEAFAYLCGLDEFEDRAKFPMPWILITDLKMPQVGGLELLQHLRNLPECRDLPVFILSSSTLEKDVSEASRLGANGFFLKPVRIEELEDIIKGIYERADMVRRSFSSHVEPRTETVSI
ncbi:MAG: response regulator [Verrucomicrobiota bacterium]